jgi:hypothetical protein
MFLSTMSHRLYRNSDRVSDPYDLELTLAVRAFMEVAFPYYHHRYVITSTTGRAFDLTWISPRLALVRRRIGHVIPHSSSGHN